MADNTKKEETTTNDLVFLQEVNYGTTTTDDEALEATKDILKEKKKAFLRRVDVDTNTEPEIWRDD